MTEEKKILVWDGIFQGYKHITKEEMKDRKALQKKMNAMLWKVVLWIVGITLGGILLLFLVLS